MERLQQINTVMLVDDDDNWCYLSKRILKKAGFGNQILTASNGLEAINKLQALAAEGARLPELIFVDIKMPVMDGFAFLEEIAHFPDLTPHNTRIFLCSSSLHSKDQEMAERYSIAGFIPKPLTVELLNDIL